MDGGQAHRFLAVGGFGDHLPGGFGGDELS
jgi:hypothetical protein